MAEIYKSRAGAEKIRSRYREVLGSWPVPSEHIRIPTREGETFVVASGPADGPPLVLLHGSGANASTWRGDIETWTTRFRVYAVDMPGEPGGSTPSRPDLATDAVASWFDDVLDGLSLQSTSLIGMSLGGWVALDYTIRRPARVDRISLLCPGGIGRQKVGWLPMAFLLGALGTRGKRRTARMVTGLDTPSMASALDDVTLTFAHFKPRTERLPVFPDSALRQVQAPVQVIVGDRDVMMDSSETARRVRLCIPTASVTVLGDTGHAIVGHADTILHFLAGRTDLN
ncbi:alpha/beta fold hydrolase [Rhodococcoides yunnanense]|uniref:alpha/beta fold hydrolase n=1 Tax=Rhodococcoides yunnanense TaxID=278209 RepID=UPI00093387CA|nr:alpha/beta hydrolase [Rhodococcus yunnanensis]